MPTYLRQVAQIPASEKRRKTRWSVPVRQLGMRAAEDYLHVNVRLADFGEAQESSGGNLDLIQPNKLRAPEVILRTGWGTRADIWNLACIVSDPPTCRPVCRAPDELTGACPHRFGRYSNEGSSLMAVSLQLTATPSRVICGKWSII